jgi:hypothetical protein
MPHRAPVDTDTTSPTAAPLLCVIVHMPDGGVLSPPVKDGDRLIDGLAAFGLPMRRDPGYAPCRSRIEPMWVTRLKPADRVEQSILTALGADDGATRLLDHLVMTPELNGLKLELPWDTLIPQTYWVAG